MLGFEKVEKLIERNVIEVAPLAYMRGRTLNDAFIILDESQNTTIEQMKMFLTRIGFNSKAVITGDVTQIDLPRSTKSACATPSKCWPRLMKSALTSSTVKTWYATRWSRIVNAYEARKRQIRSVRPNWPQNVSAKRRSKNRNESGDPRFTAGL